MTRGSRSLGELYLIDSSAWLQILPPREGPSPLRERVRALLAARQVATTGIIRLEITRGAADESGYHRLSRLLGALHQLPVEEQHWDDGALLGFRLRRQGETVRSADLLIAAVAMSVGATLLHCDRHFDVIAQHSALNVERHP